MPILGVSRPCSASPPRSPSELVLCMASPCLSFALPSGAPPCSSFANPGRSKACPIGAFPMLIHARHFRRMTDHFVSQLFHCASWHCFSGADQGNSYHFNPFPYLSVSIRANPLLITLREAFPLPGVAVRFSAVPWPLRCFASRVLLRQQIPVPFRPRRRSPRRCSATVQTRGTPLRPGTHRPRRSASRPCR